MAGSKGKQIIVVGIITYKMHPTTFFFFFFSSSISMKKRIGMHLICYYSCHLFVYFVILPSLLTFAIFTCLLYLFFYSSEQTILHTIAFHSSVWLARLYQQR